MVQVGLYQGITFLWEDRMYKFCKSDGNFYNTAIHSNIPLDTVNVSNAEFREFLAMREAGKRVVWDEASGKIIAIENITTP